MKKYLSIILILSITILAWCSIDRNNEKENKITELENKIKTIDNNNNKNDIFEKNKECSMLEKEIILEAERYYWWKIYRIKEIIYSSILKSCLYKIEISYTWYNIKDFDLKDYFWKKLIITSSDELIIDEKIIELK